jgi:hypothetical protein
MASFEQAVEIECRPPEQLRYAGTDGTLTCAARTDEVNHRGNCVCSDA